MAHELGHYVLHREVAASQTFQSFEDFALWVRDHNGQKYNLEQEANEFAGRLLVPRDRMDADYQEFARQADSLTPHWKYVTDLRHAFAERVAGQFGVHPQVIETRLEREWIWPEP